MEKVKITKLKFRANDIFDLKDNRVIRKSVQVALVDELSLSCVPWGLMQYSLKK